MGYNEFTKEERAALESLATGLDDMRKRVEGQRDLLAALQAYAAILNKVASDMELPTPAAPRARPDDALQARLDAALAALIRLARAHYSYYRRRGYVYRDDAIGRRIFSDYESESDALFRVLEAEGLIRGMDDEEGGYAFVSDLADAAADQTADTTGRGFLIDSVKGRILTARSRLAQLEWLCGQEGVATERLEAAGTLLRKQILEFDRLNDAWRARGERAAE